LARSCWSPAVRCRGTLRLSPSRVPTGVSRGWLAYWLQQGGASALYMFQIAISADYAGAQVRILGRALSVLESSVEHPPPATPLVSSPIIRLRRRNQQGPSQRLLRRAATIASCGSQSAIQGISTRSLGRQPQRHGRRSTVHQPMQVGYGSVAAGPEFGASSIDHRERDAVGADIPWQRGGRGRRRFPAPCTQRGGRTG
jgi:hypothetical protein